MKKIKNAVAAVKISNYNPDRPTSLVKTYAKDAEILSTQDGEPVITCLTLPETNKLKIGRTEVDLDKNQVHDLIIYFNIWIKYGHFNLPVNNYNDGGQ